MVYNGATWEGNFLVKSNAAERTSLVFRTDGTQPVTVTATNSWGSATKTVEVRVNEAADGISNIETIGQQPAATYDLQGRRVQQARQGLYIVNGKKVIK